MVAVPTSRRVFNNECADPAHEVLLRVVYELLRTELVLVYETLALALVRQDLLLRGLDLLQSCLSIEAVHYESEAVWNQFFQRLLQLLIGDKHISLLAFLIVLL